jgi:hypothetical protein
MTRPISITTWLVISAKQYSKDRFYGLGIGPLLFFISVSSNSNNGVVAYFASCVLLLLLAVVLVIVLLGLDGYPRLFYGLEWDDQID